MPGLLSWRHIPVVALALLFCADARIQETASDIDEALLQISSSPDFTKGSGLERAPQLIDTALRKMAHGVREILVRGTPHGNSTPTQVFRWTTRDASKAANQKLAEIEKGLITASFKLDQFVGHVKAEVQGMHAAEAHDRADAFNETANVLRAARHVVDMNRERSAPKAAKIAQLQQQKEQLLAALRKMGHADGSASSAPKEQPKSPLAPLHPGVAYLRKYLLDPQPTAPPPPAPPPVEKPVPKVNASSHENATRHPSIKGSRAAPAQPLRKEEEQAPPPAPPAKVPMSQNLRFYLHLPTKSPPPSARKPQPHDASAENSPARRHLLAAEEMINQISHSMNDTMATPPEVA